MADQQLRCATCSRRFIWSAGEQAFYHERGLQSPKRCPDCRAANRRQAPGTAVRSSAPPPAARPIARRHTPRRSFGVATVVAAALLSGALLLVVPATPLLAWLIGVNLVTLLSYGYDKAVAGGTQLRVPEAVLLGLALIGGSPGAFVAMLLFRHKTSKAAFLAPFALIVLLQAVLIVALLVLR